MQQNIATLPAALVYDLQVRIYLLLLQAAMNTSIACAMAALRSGLVVALA